MSLRPSLIPAMLIILPAITLADDAVKVRITDKKSRSTDDQTSSAKSFWTMDLSQMTIPNTKAAGRIHGRGFQVDLAKFDGNSIRLQQGREFLSDLSVTISLDSRPVRSLEGKVIEVGPRNGDEEFPLVGLNWKVDGKNEHVGRGYGATCAIILRFGQLRDGVIPGSLYLCVPDAEKSFVAGTFTIGGPDLEELTTSEIRGKVINRNLSEKSFPLAVRCLGQGDKGNLETPGAEFDLCKRPAIEGIVGGCMSWSPRTTTVEWSKQEGFSHTHLHRRAGNYLVYLSGPEERVGSNGIILGWKVEGIYDWKWIELKDDSSMVTADLEVDRNKLGRLEVTVRGIKKSENIEEGEEFIETEYVTCMPLNSEGQIPLLLNYPGTEFDIPNAKLNQGKALFRVIREGKYRIAYENSTADVVIRGGKTTKAKLTAR